MPSISTLTVSPSSIGPTPAGVPVRMTSPGSSVITPDMNAIWVGRSWIIWLVRPSCTISPLTRVTSRRSDGSSTVSSHGPSGQNES